LVLVNKEIRKNRIKICNSCEFMQNPICGKCKCIIRIKTLFSKQSCPEGKWGNV